MRFEELCNPDGVVLARGLHPSIAVVAAGSGARAAVTSVVSNSCKVLRSSDIDEELERASALAIEQYEAAVEQQRDKLAQAKQELVEASAAASSTTETAVLAGADLARFDELAGHLSSADEAYEAAVHLDTEAARSLAAALVELERVLSQRHSTTAPLEQARKGRERQGAPEVIIQQAINLQAALARAEADKREAVRQADDDYQGARMASRQAQSALKEAELDLRHSLANLSTGPLECGPGVPLPGLLTTFRDRLDGALATADKAATRARSVEHAARSRVEWEARALESLLNAGPPVIDPLETAVNWAGSEHFGPDGVVFADDTFTRFGPEGVADLVTTLAGRGCQVIYLTENPQVLGWAISLPGEVGGASTIANSRNKEPGSVGD